MTAGATQAQTVTSGSLPGPHSITVALCTHNHAERLRFTLDALRTLVPPPVPWELLVIDNACSDESPMLLASVHWRPTGIPVRVVWEEKLGLSNARNRAIAEAAGSYVVFIDDDETPDREWLAAHARAICQWQPDALGGPIDVTFVDGERPRWLHDELLGFIGRLDHGGGARRLTDPATPIFGGNFAFSTAVFRKIGSFDSGLGRKGSANIGGEDTEIYERLVANGCHVRWVPDALIYHRIEAGKLRRSYFLDLHYRYGRVEGSRARNGRSHVPPRYLLPQLGRAIKSALSVRISEGRDASLRREMNVAYFLGYLLGWARD